MDYVVAGSDAYMTLPARKEGIIPGAANLRLTRFVGARAARQAIMMGRRFECDSAEGRMICDLIVPPGEMDAAIARVVEDFTGSGVVSAAGNRRAFRVGEEPLDTFRRYMAVYCREQAYCHFSPALIANLEKHWNAAQRKIYVRTGMSGETYAASAAQRHLILRRAARVSIRSRSPRAMRSAALQLKRLKWTLSHAYSNVAHYKKAFDKAGVHPDDLKSLDDLRKFPFTAKDDLRAHYPFGMFAIPREQVLRVHASSGTTGKPTVVGYSRRDLDTWADLMARCMRAAGMPVRDAGAEFVRLRPVHRRHRVSLRRRAAGHDGRAGVGRHDGAAGAPDR